MPQCLYNEEPLNDIVTVLNFINSYTKELNLGPIDIDTNIVESIVLGCRNDFPHNDGMDSASAFKKASNFLCFFISQRPILKPFSDKLFEDFMSIDNHQNAIIGFEIVKMALHKSIIVRSDGNFTVENPIQVSKHSYIDIIEALSKVTPDEHFHIVSVLLEQLVYKTNPKCQYKI